MQHKPAEISSDDLHVDIYRNAVPQGNPNYQVDVRITHKQSGFVTTGSGKSVLEAREQAMQQMRRTIQWAATQTREAARALHLDPAIIETDDGRSTLYEF